MGTTIFLWLLGLLLPVPGTAAELLRQEGYVQQLHNETGELEAYVKRVRSQELGDAKIHASISQGKVSGVIVWTKLDGAGLQERLKKAGCAASKAGTPCWKSFGVQGVVVRRCGRMLLIWDRNSRISNANVNDTCAALERL